MATSKLRPGCLHRLHVGLHGFCVEVTIIALTIASVLAVTGELLINLRVIQEPAYFSDGKSGVGSPKPSSNGGDTNNTNSSTTPDTNTGNSIDPGGDNLPQSLQITVFVFHYVSLVIAAFFVLEMVLKVVSNMKKFFKNYWEILDLFIVMATIAGEIVFTIVQQTEPLWEVATYVIILRLWRIPHACHVHARKYKQEAEEEINTCKAATQSLESQYKMLQEQSLKQTEKIAELEKELEKHTQTKKTQENHVERSQGRTITNGPMCNGHATNLATNHSTSNGVSVPMTLGDTMTNSQHHLSAGTDSTAIAMVNGLDTIDAGSVDMVDAGIVNSSDVDQEGKYKMSESSRNGQYSRTGSESSLSIQGVEQEVEVQIEGQQFLHCKNPSMTDEDAKLIRDVEACQDVSGQETNHDYSYTNESFEEELEDIMRHRDLQIVAEFDGTKTYRSAEGIPMTSL